MPENIDTIIAKYGQKVPKKPSKSRIVILSTVIIVVIAVIAVGVFAVLKDKTTPAVAPPTTQATAGPSAKDITEKVTADKTIVAATNYTLLRINAEPNEPNIDTSSIFYKHNGYDFLVNSVAEDGIRFTPNETKGATNKAEINTAIVTVLKANGFTQTDQDTSTLTAYNVVTYTNGGSVCQIIDYTEAKQSAIEQGVLCSSFGGLDKTYKDVQILLTKADSAIIATIKTVHQGTITDGTKSLKILTVTPKESNKTTRYYFATLKDDYEYIGNQPTPSVDDEASYGLSSQLKKNIADKKWGSFLSDNIK